MPRVHPQHRPDRMARPLRHPLGSTHARAAARTLAAALAVLLAGGLLALPTGAATLPTRSVVLHHKAKPLKALPTLGAAKHTIAAANGQISPYARAAAKRADSGLPPAGRAHVLWPTAANPINKPAQPNE
jgi:hypothetical protein